MYTIYYNPSVEKDIKHIPKDQRLLILRKISRLADNPRREGIEKLEVMQGYRLRVGDYRVLFMINDSLKTVEVYRIKHRKEVYR